LPETENGDKEKTPLLPFPPWGLVDYSGRVVVEGARAQSVKATDTGELYFVLIEPSADPQERRLRIFMVDGSWFSEAYPAYDLFYSERRIVAQSLEGEFAIYDESGRLLGGPFEGNAYGTQGYRQGYCGANTVDGTRYWDLNGQLATGDLRRCQRGLWEGYTLIERAAGDYSLLSPQGEEMLEPGYESVYIPEDQPYAFVTRDGLRGVMDRNGHWVKEVAYSSMGYPALPSGDFIAEKDGELFALNLSEGWEIPLPENALYYGDGWYSIGESDGVFRLRKGEASHAFPLADIDGYTIRGEYLGNDLFAVNYMFHDDSIDSFDLSLVRYDIFDGGAGAVIQSYPYLEISDGFYEDTFWGDFLPLYDNSSKKMVLLDNTFAVVGGQAFQSITPYHDQKHFLVEDDDYTGIMRLDGSWLIQAEN
jgi:hypothetical protein